MAAEEGRPPDKRDEDDFRAAGTRLGRFVILGELGRGSMGVVYEAFQEDLKRKVALKLLPANISLDQKQIKRFQREAQSAARLNHPNVIQIFEVGHEKKTHFIAMELIDGRSFESFQARDEEEVREVARIGRDAARGLHHAHEQGIIHRDIKPGNLLITKDGRPTVSDFGLARQTDSATLTSMDAIVGTPKYMSPEQILPTAGKPLDGRTDIYSLGASLYEILCGRPPIQAPSVPAYLRAVLEERPPSPRKFNKKIPMALGTILLRCLEKNPADRYPDAAMLAQDLDRFLSGERILARPKGRLALAIELIRRRPVISALSALVVLAVITLIGLAGGKEEAEDRLALEQRITTAINQLDLSERVLQLGVLAKEHPRSERVQSALSTALLQRAKDNLGHAAPDFETVLSDLERAEAPDERWRSWQLHWSLMTLIELKRLEQARQAVSALAPTDPLQRLTLARIHVARHEFEEAVALLVEYDALDPTLQFPTFPLTSGLAYRGLASLELARTGSEQDPDYRALLQTALRHLRNAQQVLRTSPQEWLRGIVVTMEADVDLKLGRETNIDALRRSFGGATQGLLDIITEAWGGETQQQVDIAEVFVRSILDLTGQTLDLPAVLLDTARKGLQGDPQPKEALRWQLLYAVANMSGGKHNEALRSLRDALGAASELNEDAEVVRLLLYIHWGRSLLFHRARLFGDAENQILEALQEALNALAYAERLADFKLADLKVLLMHLCALGDDLIGSEQEDALRQTIAVTESALKGHPDVGDTVKPFLTRARKALQPAPEDGSGEG
ncbi:MAG: serine/threonine-protein kinase [Planctomycetota bacterium]|nr:serine/threonine-protein kinase [Planctomycetota bacterium]